MHIGRKVRTPNLRAQELALLRSSVFIPTSNKGHKEDTNRESYNLDMIV